MVAALVGRLEVDKIGHSYTMLCVKNAFSSVVHNMNCTISFSFLRFEHVPYLDNRVNDILENRVFPTLHTCFQASESTVFVNSYPLSYSFDKLIF